MNLNKKTFCVALNSTKHLTTKIPQKRKTNRFIVTWMLHQIFMSSDKEILTAV